MALESAKQVEALADALSECADSAHERLLRLIENKQIGRAEAQSLFQEEATLRQRANALYIDAAKCVVKDLDLTQRELLDTIDKANRRLKKIKKIAAFIDLVTDIVALASASLAAKPGPILAAFKEVRKDVEELAEGK